MSATWKSLTSLQGNEAFSFTGYAIGFGNKCCNAVAHVNSMQTYSVFFAACSNPPYPILSPNLVACMGVLKMHRVGSAFF